MEIKSYKDVDGNKVVMGDLVEIIYSKEPEAKKVVAMKKRGHMVFVRFEGEYVHGWTWGTKHTRKIIKA